MTVRPSMDVDIYDISIHGWASNAYRTPSWLPLSIHYALPALIPVLSRLPNGSHAPEDIVLSLHL
jgi:hypothetical protein